MNMKQFAWIGDEALKQPVKGVVVDFHGLGYSGMKHDPNAEDLELADAGALTVFPYYGPWSWMNRHACQSVNELIDRVYSEYALADEVPLILKGGSMGGSSALVFARYSNRPVTACAVNCPVADVPFHYTERDDLPRTMHYAFGHYGIPLQEAMEQHSPLHLVASLPDIPYLIVHGDRDSAVNKQKHSDVLVQKMRQRGMNVEYIEASGMGHCTYNDHQVLRRMMNFLLMHINS